MSAEAARRDVAPQFDVVAIGASAGGVEALHVVAAALPADFPVPVLIVQHMDPRHKSMLAGLLGRRCKLRVKQAVDGEEMEGGTVYIAQPAMHLVVRAGRLVLTDTKLVHFSRPSIDLLFESGADGIRDIKAKGGTTLVQDPSSAAHAGMPQAARATRCVDFTLPLEEIGPALASLVAPPAGDET